MGSTEGKSSAHDVHDYCADAIQGFVILPKSVTLGRIEENAKLYDFELSQDDMKSLQTGLYEPCAWDPTTSKD